MPPVPAINNALRVLANFRIGDAFLGQTHFDFKMVSFDFDQSSAEDVVSMIGEALLGNDVDGALSTDVTIPLWEVHWLDDPDLAPIFVDSDFTGGEAGDPLPPNVAAIVSFHTGFSGRSHRGRSYWPGFTEASADGVNFNTTSAGNLGAAYFDIQGGIDDIASGSKLGVISMKNATVLAVDTLFVEPTFATQRRRLGRLRAPSS
jgi:hypothetical protein